RRDDASDLVDALEVRLGLALHLVGQRLDEVAAAEGIDRIGDTRLVGQQLLGAKREPRGFVGRQRQYLVHRVRMQRLRPTQHRGQIRRAARNLAISSKKSMWASKKNERRDAKSSMCIPRSRHAST